MRGRTAELSPPIKYLDCRRQSVQNVSASAARWIQGHQLAAVPDALVEYEYRAAWTDSVSYWPRYLLDGDIGYVQFTIGSIDLKQEFIRGLDVLQACDVRSLFGTAAGWFHRLWDELH